MRWPRSRPRQRDAELDEELESHIQMAVRDRIDRGESPSEARRHALVDFGSRTLAREETRAVWTWTAVEQLAVDLQLGVRILWRAPGLSATAVLLIALVIGGNLTIFSMVHSVLAKPAAGVTAGRLVTVGWVYDGDEHPVASYPDYLDIASGAKTITPLLAFDVGRFILTTADGSYAIEGATVSANYFATLAVTPQIGRTFTSSEDHPNASGLVAVISDRLWHERFAGTPDVVGRPIVVNGHLATIVGVAPPSFRGVIFGEGSDVWMPLAAYAEADGRRDVLTDRLARTIAAIGQLAPGVSLAAAQDEMTAIVQRLPHDPRDTFHRRTIQLFPYTGTAAGDSLVARRGPWFLAMFSIITALTLLVACANVANLMLARAVVRAREMAVRQSFGASRVRIVRIFVAEALAIAGVAWSAAALLAVWTTRTVPRFIPPLDNSAARITFDFTPDWYALGYAMMLALAGAVVVSAAPAWRTCRQDLQPLLKAGGQGLVHGRSTVSGALVVVQLAFSVLLMTAAGLGYRSVSILEGAKLGFDHDRLLLVTINTKEAARTAAANAALLDRMIVRLRTIRGVTAASYAHRPVQSFWQPVPVGTDGSGRHLVAERNEVGPGFLHMLQLAPISGRDFDERDAGSATVPAIVNARLAASLWPDQSPLGRVLRLPGGGEPLLIVGVAPDAFYNGYRREPDPNFVFVSGGRTLPPSGSGEVTLYLRYSGTLDEIVPAVGRALRDEDGHAPIVYTRTLDTQLQALTWPVNALTVLLISFACGSLLIAAIGQYAAMAFTMRRRIRDFGIRMALGASTDDILHSVLREGLRLTAVGLAVGGALSLATATGLRSMLFGVSPADARTYAAVVLVLSAATLVACYVPARRASRIDPMQALREE